MSLNFAPSSSVTPRAGIKARDILLACLVPPLTFWLRDSLFFSEEKIDVVIEYTAISLCWSMIVFFVMQTNRGLSRYFSREEAKQIFIASAIVAGGAALTSFMMSRLDSIPRSFPLLHLLVMSVSHTLVRVWSYQRHLQREKRFAFNADVKEQNIIVLGCTRLAWFYIRMIDTFTLGRQKVVAILDERERYWGRSIGGRLVAGSIHQLANLVDEYEVHGVRVHSVVVAIVKEQAQYYDWDEVAELCAKHSVRLTYLPDVLGLTDDLGGSSIGDQTTPLITRANPAIELSSYWAFKRGLDFVVSFFFISILSPLFFIVAVATWFDVGSPILFWQQRIGQRGDALFVYKFRSLRAPFDRDGRKIPEEERLSPFGKFFRRTRLDELPQLWNIFSGEMSFIGPRPLMPVDHPEDDYLRSAVPPGVTGWAQVKGGRLITPDEKSALDDWYVRHASFWLDLKIVFLTVVFVLLGDRRDEEAIRLAIVERDSHRNMNS